MVDVLLIQPPIEDFYHTAKRTIPYGLVLVAAAVAEKGYSVSILDGLANGKSRVIGLPDELSHIKPYTNRPDQSPFALFHKFRHYGYSLDHIGNEAKKSNAFLVGVSSLFTAYSDMALAVARKVKKILPESYIVLGGHHPTALPQAVMEEPAVDFVLRGEGETCLPKLMDALKGGRVVTTVPGIVVRKQDGSLHVSNPAINVNPNDQPNLDLTLIRRSFYQRFGKDSISITAGRGCPLDCSYCSTGKNSWMGYRTRSVASVLNEIRSAAKGRRIGFIDFEDENLTMDRNWFLELMYGIRRLFGNFMPELRAMNGLYPPTITKEVVQAMKATGFRTLNLSLGSAESAQLRRFNRPDVRKAFDRALIHAKEENLSAVGYIIVGAPEQNPESSVSDLLFLAHRRVLAGVSVFYPAPGSADWNRCGTLGLLPSSFSAMRATALPIDQCTTRRDSITLWRLGRVLNFMKSILSDGGHFPSPTPVGKRVDPNLSRAEKGLILLASFLDDGIIRGVEPDGTVYQHRTSQHLSELFIKDLRKSKFVPNAQVS